MFSNDDSFDSFMQEVLKLFPKAIFDEGVGGEITIHTGWRLRSDSTIAHTADWNPLDRSF